MNHKKNPAPLLGVITPEHTDLRRTLSEFNGDTFSIQLIDCTQRLPLGNHYHKAKDETFILLKGKGLFMSVGLDEAGQPLGDVQTQHVGEKQVIFVPAYLAHTFILDEGSELLCFSSVRFNKENMDLIPYKLI